MKNRFYKYSSALKNKYQYFLLYILFFYFIFLPDLSFLSPLLKNSIILILLDLIFAILYIKDIINYYDKNKKIFYLTLLFLSIYTFFVTLIKGVSIINNMGAIIFVLKLLLFVFLMYKLNILYTSHQQKIKFLINLGNIQGIICLLMVIIPPLKKISDTLYIANFENYYHSAQFGITSHRIYGICSDFTFSFSIVMAMIAAISFVNYFIRKDKYYLISTLLCLIPSFLNGRTGTFIFCLIFIISIIVFFERKWITKKKIIYFFILILFTPIIVFCVLEKTNNLQWIINGFTEVINLFQGKLTGTFEVLFNQFIFIPNNILGLFFGEGFKVFGSIGKELIGKSSDIGFINDLFRGGILYIVSFYGMLIYVLFKCKKKLEINYTKKYSFMICLTLFLFFFISNLKGEALSGSSILFVGLFLMDIYSSDDTKIEMKGDF